MKHWTIEDIADGADLPDDVSRITLAVMEKSKVFGDWPRLVRVSRHDDDNDFCRFEVVMELAPGVVLPAERGTIEGLFEGWEEEDEQDEEQAVAWVMEGIAACMSRIDALSDIVHDARQRARRHVAGWHHSGLDVRLIAVTLAPHDHWRGDAEPGLHVLVEALEANLMPTELIIQVEKSADLELEMEKHRDGLAAEQRLRAEMSAGGATGTISRLALNAIGEFHDIPSTLRRFRKEWRFWLPDSTCLMFSRGNVSAGTGLPEGRFQWRHDGVCISGNFTPESELRTYVGQPVTEFLDHEFLSEDMIVREASTSFHEGVPMISITMDIPNLFFCAETGRVWEMVGPTPAAVTFDGAETSTVVPFRKRRA